MKAFLTPEFRTFLLTGGFSAAVNLGSRVVYQKVLTFAGAVLLAYRTGMVTAYVLARRFVFTSFIAHKRWTFAS